MVPKLEVENNSLNPIRAISQSSVVRKESLHETLLQKKYDMKSCVCLCMCVRGNDIKYKGKNRIRYQKQD